jgi:hypothetical protein
MEPESSLRIHKCPPPVLILKHISPDHAPQPNSWISILILSSHLLQGFPCGLFSSVSPPKSCIHLYSPQYVLHAPPTLFFTIWSIGGGGLMPLTLLQNFPVFIFSFYFQSELLFWRWRQLGSSETSQYFYRYLGCPRIMFLENIFIYLPSYVLSRPWR